MTIIERKGGRKKERGRGRGERRRRQKRKKKGKKKREKHGREEHNLSFLLLFIYTDFLYPTLSLIYFFFI